MRKAVEIVNWAALGLFLVSIGFLYRSNPGTVTGANFLVLLPYCSGLLAVYRSSEKAAALASISVNAMYLLLAIVVVISVLIGWASYPTGAVLFFGILGIVPAALNVVYGGRLL